MIDVKVKILVPTQFQKITESSEIYITSSNVEDALYEFTDLFPPLYDRIYDSLGKLNKFINIFVNEEDIRFLNGIDTHLNEGDKITILAAISGG